MFKKTNTVEDQSKSFIFCHYAGRMKMQYLSPKHSSKESFSFIN